MTKRFGSLVGAVKQLVPPRQTQSAYENSHDSVLVRDTIELAAAPAADTIQAAVLPWETVLDPYGCNLSFDDLGVGTTLSLGDATYPNALCNAQDVAAAAGSASAVKSVDIANYFKPLWAQLGYASLAAAKAVGAQCELIFTIGAAAATGTLTWSIKGQKR